VPTLPPLKPLRPQIIRAILCAAILIAGVWLHAYIGTGQTHSLAMRDWETRQDDIVRLMAKQISQDILLNARQGQDLSLITHDRISRLAESPLPSPRSQLFLWTRHGTLYDPRTENLPTQELDQLVRQQARLGAKNLETLAAAAQDATNGKALYRWSRNSETEHVSWASVRLPDDTWTIFLSTPEQDIYKAAYIQEALRDDILLASISTCIILIALWLLLRALRTQSSVLSWVQHAEASVTCSNHLADLLTAAFDDTPVPQVLMKADGQVLRTNRFFRTSMDVVWVEPPVDFALEALPGWGEHAGQLQRLTAQALAEGGAEAEISLPGPSGRQRRYTLRLTTPKPVSRTLPATAASNPRAEVKTLLLCLFDITESTLLSSLLEESRSLLEHRVLERTEELGRANRRLDDSRRRMQALLDNMPDIAWLKDATGRYISVNAPFVASLGLNDPVQINGQFDSVLLTPEEAKFTREIDQRIILERKPIRLEQPYTIPELGVRWHEVIRTPIFDEAGLVVGIVGIARDMTEHRAMLQELESSEAELRRLNQLLLSSQEEERTRIGQELHDSSGQMLTGIKWLVERARLSLGKGKGTKEVGSVLAEIVPMVQRTEEELARVLLALRPKVLDELGLVAAVQSMCREFEQGNPNFALRVKLAVEEQRLSPAVRTAVFRVLQEALNNTARHSQASRVVVRLLSRDNSLIVHVGDNGCGFDETATHKGIGLRNFANRATYAGGSFQLHSVPGVGTSLRFHFPLMPKNGAESSVE